MAFSDSPPRCCDVPAPDVPYEILPLFALTYSTSSFAVLTGTVALTTSACGALATMVIGVKSFTVS